jgi:hypothetical protein
VVELSEKFFRIFNIFYLKLEGVLESGDMASSPSHLPPGNTARYKIECKPMASPGLFLEGLKGEKILPQVEIGSRILGPSACSRLVIPAYFNSNILLPLGLYRVFCKIS